MIENWNTQLGLYLEENQAHAKLINDMHFSNLQNELVEAQKSGVDYISPSSEFVEKGKQRIAEILCLQNTSKNINYLLKDTAKKMAYEIPVQNEQFSVKYLAKMPSKKATFLLGENFFYRYLKTDNNIYVGAFGTPNSVHNRIRHNLSIVPDIYKTSLWCFFRIELNTGNIILPDKASTALEQVYARVWRNDDISDEELKELNDNLKSTNSALSTLYTDKDEPLSRAMFRRFVQLLLFVELSDLSVEILKPNQRTGTRKTGKYINRSNKDITIVDSKWNVISVRTEGFKVKTHPRMQPCGEGNKERKLIWVQQYEKKGYVRRKANKIQI